ncbi:MAG TPA: hypothetical protein VLG38_02765, partial [Gammaproteobacteria bacterium]|nr:hypothetical protein [Gammaproteobacteria bacterium]
MILAAVAVPLTLLITTNIGLNAVFTIVTMFTPVQFSYGQVSGKIIGAPIKISNVTLIHTGRTLKIENVTFDWQLKALTANNIRGLEQFLPYASKVAYQEFLINKAYAQINFKENSLVFNVQLFGQAAQAPLHGNVRLTNHNSMWDINHAVLMIGDNVINLQRHNVKQYKWNITIKQPNVMFKNSTGTIIAHGHIQDLNTTPSIQAHVQTKHFAMSNYAVNNLQARVNLVIQPSAPLFANITASNVRFDATHLEDIKLSLHGDLAQHTLNFNAMYENEPVALHIKGRLNEKMWHAHDLMLGYKKEQLVGTSTYNLKDRSSTTSLRGSIATFPTTAVLKFT